MIPLLWIFRIAQVVGSVLALMGVADSGWLG